MVISSYTHYCISITYKYLLRVSCVAKVVRLSCDVTGFLVGGAVCQGLQINCQVAQEIGAGCLIKASLLTHTHTYREFCSDATTFKAVEIPLPVSC